MPKISPQNAADRSRNDIPDAVTRKVIKAASRSAGIAIAALSAPPIAASSARPARAAIRAGGNAVKMETSVAPNTPSSR